MGATLNFARLRSGAYRIAENRKLKENENSKICDEGR
jgi:hypothetical protein